MPRNTWRVVGICSNKRRIALERCSSAIRAERLRRLLLATKAFDDVLIELDQRPGPNDLAERDARRIA